MKNYELFAGIHQRCLAGIAARTSLPGQSATSFFGEAMLTLQGTEQKRRIAKEAARLLNPGGRYGIHELCIL